jgi:hypothetical protein
MMVIIRKRKLAKCVTRQENDAKRQLENQKAGEQSGNISVNGSIILKWILKKLS